MQLKKTLKRLTGSREQLFSAARDIGHELPRNNLKLLADLRAELANYIAYRVQGDPDQFIVGYWTALADLLAAYDAAISNQLQQQELNVVTMKTISNALKKAGWKFTAVGTSIELFEKEKTFVIMLEEQITVKAGFVTAMTKMSDVQLGILHLPGENLGGIALTPLTAEQTELSNLIRELA